MSAKLCLPRNQFVWHPQVHAELCQGDRVCIDFCANGVFEWDEAGNFPRVRNPDQCSLGCDACAKLCPSGALTFPPREELRRQIQAWRKREREEQMVAK